MQYNKLEDTSGMDPKHIQSRDINAGGSVSIDPNHLTATPDPDEARRKKIKWIIIGSVLLVIVILAIVLPLTLIHHGGDDNGGGHGPLPPGQMNPYNAIPNTAKYDGKGTRFSGYLLADVGTTAKLEKSLAMSAVPSMYK